MKFLLLAAALGFATSAFAYNSTYTLSYYALYDNATTPLTDVTCSNGENGLITQGYKDFEDIPSYPYIGGISGLKWNSYQCGSCYKISYTHGNGVTVSFNMTAINNVAGSSHAITTSAEALKHLGLTVDKGPVSVNATRLPKNACYHP